MPTKIVMCLITMSRHNERHVQKYHLREDRDRQKSTLTRAPTVHTVHIGADVVGITQQCMCDSFQFHSNVIAFFKQTTLRILYSLSKTLICILNCNPEGFIYPKLC